MEWNSSWKGSVQPRKQRTYVYNAPHHIRSGLMASALGKELKSKHKMNSVRVRVGDTVKILRGQFKKRTGKIERVEVKRQRVFVSGASQLKKDGSSALYPIHPSNLMVIEFEATKPRKFGKAKPAEKTATHAKPTSAAKTKSKGKEKSQ